MVKAVMIARVLDALPLCAYMGGEEQQQGGKDASTLDTDFPDFREQLRTLTKALAMQAEAMCSVDAKGNGRFSFHVLVADGVGFICLCERAYPRKLAFAFLADVHKNFASEFSSPQVAAPGNRPYAFIRFETTIQRLMRSFQDSRAKQNIARLQEELLDVSQIMTSNIQQVLERGNRLEKMSLMSETLSADSKRYMRDARYLNIQAMYQKYGPLVLLCAVALLVLYLKVYVF